MGWKALGAGGAAPRPLLLRCPLAHLQTHAAMSDWVGHGSPEDRRSAQGRNPLRACMLGASLSLHGTGAAVSDDEERHS